MISLNVVIIVQVFYESFDESFDGRWIVSVKDEYQGLTLF